MGMWALIFGGMIPLGSLEAGLLADLIGAVVCALAAFVTVNVIRKREAQLAADAR